MTTADLGTLRYNCLGFPYVRCPVCGKAEVRISVRTGELHASHLKGPRHRRAALQPFKVE